MFNVDAADAAKVRVSASLPIDDDGWSIGVVVGPSGSGKTTIGRAVWGANTVWEGSGRWPETAPIVDAIAPGSPVDDVTAALAAVGLGSVPAWLRPYHVLSNGERFRADLARVIAEAPPRVVIDEFSSVVDRQIAKVGGLAFAKSWRRTKGQAVLLSCHYDILEWVEPDWVYDTASQTFTRGSLWQRPKIELAIYETDWRFWPLFEPHHYLKIPKMIAATNYVGVVEGRPVTHLAVTTLPGMKAARASRLVVMPEWQGAGLGVRFLDAVCERWKAGGNRYGIQVPTFFHTSHPGLVAALRRSKKWVQVSAMLHGDNKAQSERSITKAAGSGAKAGYGGHLRASQGFVYGE